MPVGLQLPLMKVSCLNRLKLRMIGSTMIESANSYFPRYLGVYLYISWFYLSIDNGNKAAARNDMLSFPRSNNVSSSRPMECPLLYNG